MRPSSPKLRLALNLLGSLLTIVGASMLAFSLLMALLLWALGHLPGNWASPVPLLVWGALPGAAALALGWLLLRAVGEP